MQQARFLGNEKIVIEEGPEPVAGPGEVLLRVENCALCGSDFKLFYGGHPRTPGHEISGIVDAPGHKMHGRRCVAYIPVFCGKCEECRRGNTHCCTAHRPILIGWTLPGGYAEAVAVPEQCLLPIPDDLPAQLAPLVLDTVGTTAHGIRLAQRIMPKPRHMTVFGAGPIGLGVILVAQAMGIDNITCVEPREYRAKKAASFGARIATPDELKPADLIVEASGNKKARQAALERTAPQGACVFLGESATWELDENVDIKLKDFYLVRSFYFPLADHEPNLEILRNDKERFGSLIDEAAGLDRLEGMFSAFARGERLKPMLQVG